MEQTVSEQIVSGQLDAVGNKNELSPSLLPLVHINSKWVMDLTVKPKVILESL